MQVESTKKSPGTLSGSLRARRAIKGKTSDLTTLILYDTDSPAARRAPLDLGRGGAGGPRGGGGRGGAGVPRGRVEREALDGRGGAGIGAHTRRTPPLHVACTASVRRGTSPSDRSAAATR